MTQGFDITALTGSELEQIVYRLFTSYFKGFSEENVYLTGKSGDYGIDVLATSDNERTYGVQVKAYTGAVGLAAVQQVVAAKAMYHYDMGMVVTNSYLTPNAKILAQSNNIQVIEGAQLLHMIKAMNGIK